MIYVAAQEAPTEEPTTAPSEAATEAPTSESTDAPIIGGTNYYVVGTFNEWQASEANVLTKNDAAEGDEYYINGVELKANDEFKVISVTAGVEGGNTQWYPDGMDNNYVVAADGTYDIYFRPNYDGGEDWYYNVIYVAAQEAPTEAPTTEPTEAPTEGKIRILGDADGNGEVESIDATYILRYNADLTISIDLDTLMNGDVDANGELDVVDATYIQRFLAEYPVPFAIGQPIA